MLSTQAISCRCRRLPQMKIPMLQAVRKVSVCILILQVTAVPNQAPGIRPLTAWLPIPWLYDTIGVTASLRPNAANNINCWIL